ncbi:hypothetical protein [Streptomyces purpureus]|nr:hypothetical protein [Streptomyces purpureus]
MSVLLVEAVLAAEVLAFTGLDEEAYRRPDDPSFFLVQMPAIFCFGLPFAAVGALVALLVTVAGEWLGRRFTGREVWWWLPVPAAVAAAVPVAAGYEMLRFAFGLTPGEAVACWLLVTLGLSVAALVAHLAGGQLSLGRRPKWQGRVYGGGALVSALIFALGTAVYATGLVGLYRPPHLGEAGVTGIWTSNGKGTLRLEKDGTARAAGAPLDTWRGDTHHEGCVGEGTWRYESAEDTEETWDQKLHVSIGDCWYGPWRVSGTEAEPKLVYEVGDPDSPDWFVLTR